MEKKTAQIVVSDIHLIKVEVVKQRLDVAAYKRIKKPGLNVGHRFLHNIDDERVKLSFVFSFQNAQKQAVLFFQIDFHFQISHLSNFYVLKEANLPVFNAQLVATLIGISFSTSRGIILEKLNNAGIPNVILPVVSPQAIMKNNNLKKGK
jgi:hypothetical protein